MTNVTSIKKLNYSMLPEHGRDSMQRYIENRIPPGSFLTAVLCNDLKEAFSRADHINIKCIEDYVRFLFNEAPAVCWGSHDNYENWLRGVE